MSFSVSSSKPFSSIDWSSFENRPEIKDTMPFCTEKNWYKDSKCCADGYSIEHALETIPEKKIKTPEARFLEKYPCVNGLELESLVERVSGGETSMEQPKPLPPVLDDGSTCEARAVKAFLKFVKSVGHDDTQEVLNLKKTLKVSCEKLIDMAVRYARASR
jgi:hypothetical protein